MSNDLVSVIVPIYNAEKTIQRCVGSILRQTYQSFELILIDDGSKDQSGQICDEYAKKDPRVKVAHTPNGGVSHARNMGIDCANGEYILFVDADDWIESNHIQALLPVAEEDLVCGGMNVYRNGILSEVVCSKEVQFNQHDWLFDFWSFWVQNNILAPWRSCYKRYILKKHNIKFDTHLDIGEDEHFNLRYLKYCRSIRFTHSSTYCYEAGDHLSAMKKYHPTRLQCSMAICSAIEDLSAQDEYAARWYYWHGAIRHYRKWLNRSDMSRKLVILRHTRGCYQSAYFRDCIPYIRENGTLDQKIETYFMRWWLHPLYQPFCSCVAFMSRLKNRILGVWYH